MKVSKLQMVMRSQTAKEAQIDIKCLISGKLMGINSPRIQETRMKTKARLFIIRRDKV